MGWCCDWQKISKLAWGFSDSCSINGSKETSASTARGFYCFCLTTNIHEQIRSICLIRGRKKSREQVFIYVYRLAIDARPKRGDGVTSRKYPSLLEDFQTGVASMTRKRHHASIARGFWCFCLAPSIRKLIRSIRLIRGRIQSKGQELSTRRRISLWLQGSLFCTANGSYFVLWGLRRSCKAGLGVTA